MNLQHGHHIQFSVYSVLLLYYQNMIERGQGKKEIWHYLKWYEKKQWKVLKRNVTSIRVLFKLDYKTIYKIVRTL